MIVGSLVEPVSPVRRRPVPRPATITRVIGVVVCLAAFGGALAWITTLSPIHFGRWRAIDTAHNVTFTEPGRYVVFEEGDGAASRVGPTTLTIGVRSVAGKVVETDPEIDEGGRSTTTYQIPFVQGRALTSFVIDRPGKYIVLSFPGDDGSGRGRSGDPDLSGLPTLALARDGEPAALGATWGLLLVAGLPALAGLAVLLVARAIWPSPLHDPRSGRTGRRARRAAARSAPSSPL